MATLPTLYEYYTAGGISSGLSASQNYFTLNNRNITLYSGAMHYFRVPKPYWRDRLRKMRAAGLNTVETYMPWNLHEPEIEFLDIETFLKTAQEEDMLAIVRPGPYICAEWEYGGLPSWLQREKIFVRTSDSTFMKHVTRYFNILLPILAAFQFTLGGPIIAFQVENEYGNTEQPGVFMPDKAYLEQLRQLNIRNGIVELLFTSDTPTGHGDVGTLPEYFLQTANFGHNPEREFNRLKELQPNKPIMAMEFWTGWFDHWAEHHHTRDNRDFYNTLDRILKYPASVNMYMFLGGTNFGFLNGANQEWGSWNEAILHTTTSYDYDAPLSEAGDYTEKYDMVKELISKYNTVPIRNPPTPASTPKIAYPNIQVTERLEMDEIIDRISEKFVFPETIAMENLPINNNSGQSYGYIIYRKTGLHIPSYAKLKVENHVCDTVMVLIDGVLVSKPLSGANDFNGFGYWRIGSGILDLGSEEKHNATLELVAENWGRSNYGWLEQFWQLKGLHQGDVYLNEDKLENWETMPLEFKKKWTNSLTGWRAISDWNVAKPALYKATFEIGEPMDTFVDMKTWTKGIVIINGFVLGRYATPLGPQQTLYLPAPLLQEGVNEMIVFEQFYPGKEIAFSTVPKFYTP
ncbi:hypothetical protein RI129_001937 [Pyrocoelia pectoralis]|uniref:Beta-galactosidase n=1 Tax=Pyrocoelia pectoralis TaxID=417401 RepID=A0AAN7VYS6_9COLE